MFKNLLWFGLTLVLLTGCASAPGQTIPSVSGQTIPSAPGQTIQGTQKLPSPLLSLNAPAYTNDDCQGAYPAGLADDGNYNTNWQSCLQPSASNPAWLAYDLSSIPVAQRGKVLVVWYNETFNYDHTVINDNAYDMSEDYTIDVNSIPGGGNPPTSGWTTHTVITGNHYHSRQAIIDMAGANWLRINVTAVDGSPQNYNVSLNMDVYNASQVMNDDFIFYGASVVAGSLGHRTAAGTGSFAELINAQRPDHFPVQEDGGIAYLTSGDAVKHIHTWLALFPGKYVGLSYGTNDALGCVSPDDFYSNYVQLVQAIIQAGKIPLVSHIPWSTNNSVQKCVPALNAKLDKLATAFPQLIKGPDFWSLFLNHPELLEDGIHPNEQGIALYRKAWVHTVLSTIYHS